MRIGIDGHMIGDHSGGNESYYYNILLNMVFDPEDVIILFLKSGVDDTPFKNKYQIVRFESEGAFRRNFIELNRLCRRYKLDLLHTQYFIPIIKPCKLACTIHDICFEHYKNIFTKKEYMIYKLLVPYAARCSDVVFTVSNHAKSDITEHYRIQPKKVVVTYNAVNDDFRELTNDELNDDDLRNKYGIEKNDFILTVGNLQPRKNLLRLIQAYYKWREKKDSKAKLVVVGKKAWMYADIFAEVKKDDGSIVFTDYVDISDLIRLYNSAKCFVYPSFFEGFGIPPLEAMACGTPVAVANNTSLPEVVGDAGIYFDPFSIDQIANAIDRLMSDRELRKALKSRGLKRASEFNWKKTSEVIMKYYKYTVNGCFSNESIS